MQNRAKTRMEDFLTNIFSPEGGEKVVRMEIEILENKPTASSKAKSNKRKRQKAKKKLMKKNESQIMDQKCDNLEVSVKLRDCTIVGDDLEKNLSKTDIILQPQLENSETVIETIDSLPPVNTNTSSVDQKTMDTGVPQSLAEGNVDSKRRRNKQRKKKAKIKDATSSTDQTNVMLNLHQESDGKPIEEEGQTLEPIFSTRKESPLPDLLPEEDHLSLCKDAETVDLSNTMEGGSKIYSSGLGEVTSGPSLEPKRMEEKFLPLDIQHQNGPNTNHMYGDNGNLNSAQESELSTREESSLLDVVFEKENASDSRKEEEAAESLHEVEDSSNKIPSELGDDRPRPNELKILHTTDPNPMDGENETSKAKMDERNNEIAVFEEKCSVGGNNALSSCDVVATRLSSWDAKATEFIANGLELNPRIALPVTCIKRKLIVLDVNGLLAHIVMPPPYDYTADAYILGRAIFKRPYCDDFLEFCFDNFDVGVWSSRSKKIIERVVDYLLGRLRDKLKFCWDMDHSTQTGFKTLENNCKPLVCKELSKIWENENPDLIWKKGDYDESNTLLLDDSPYKALLNPLHTAIFPHSYHYHDMRDKSIGPVGDLRIYLEGLLRCDNVQKYVEQHPFGQSAINENNMSWNFYSGVLQTLSNRMENNNCSAIPS